MRREEEIRISVFHPVHFFIIAVVSALEGIYHSFSPGKPSLFYVSQETIIRTTSLEGPHYVPVVFQPVLV